jgi:hypothetical protein
MTLPFPEPTIPIDDRREVFLGYLAFFRSALRHKLEGLDDAQLRTSVLPSGWTPLELLQHLTYVELRWLVWGLEGEDVADPWGDRRGDRWYVADAITLDGLLDAQRVQADRTESIVRAHELSDVGRPGPRWDGEPPATLERVLFHLVQEYARHAGHLDVVRELLDGSVGED